MSEVNKREKKFGESGDWPMVVVILGLLATVVTIVWLITGAARGC